MTNTRVTGQLGFIGPHLVEKLCARGDRVLVLDDRSTGVLRSAPRPDFVDMSHRRPDLSQSRSLIGFAPRLGLDDILVDVIEHSLAAREESVP